MTRSTLASSVAAVCVVFAGSAQAALLELSNTGPLGDLGTSGTPTGQNSITSTLFTDLGFTAFSTTDSGQPISFDLTLTAEPTRFVTQTGDGLGVATSATGVSSQIFQPLTLEVSNATGVPQVLISEARFGGVFGSDDLTANEITIDVSLGTGDVTGDFIDAAVLDLTPIAGSMRIEAIGLVAIPEPTSVAALALGGFVPAWRRRR